MYELEILSIPGKDRKSKEQNDSKNKIAQFIDQVIKKEASVFSRVDLEGAETFYDPKGCPENRKVLIYVEQDGDDGSRGEEGGGQRSEAPRIRLLSSHEFNQIKDYYTNNPGKLESNPGKLENSNIPNLYSLPEQTFHQYVEDGYILPHFDATWHNVSLTVGLAGTQWMFSSMVAQPLVFSLLSDTTANSSLLAGAGAGLTVGASVSAAFTVLNPLLLPLLAYVTYYQLATRHFEKQYGRKPNEKELAAIHQDAKHLAFKIMAGIVGWTLPC